MSRLDSYFTDSLTVNGQVDLNSTIVSNVAIPTPTGATIQMTSDQYLVAATLGVLNTVNVLLPTSPTIGETHIIKALGLSGFGAGTVRVIVSGSQKIDGSDGLSFNTFVQVNLTGATGGTTNSAITLVYGATNLWLVVNTLGNVNYA